ncbi:hypothetical protein BGZ72_000537 [Mortierella alpina]|nr:hypothetical protein BGZ72_000537 [Mortierella alpina]
MLVSVTTTTGRLQLNMIRLGPFNTIILELIGGGFAQRVGATGSDDEMDSGQPGAQNNQVIRSIVDPESSDAPQLSAGDTPSRDILRKLQDYYKSCMDENLIEERGAAPLVEEIGRVLRIFPVAPSPFISGDDPASHDRHSMGANETVNKRALSLTLAHFNRMGLESFNSFQSHINTRDPRARVIHLLCARPSESLKGTLFHENYTAAVAETFERILGHFLTGAPPSLNSPVALSNSDPSRWLTAANYAVQFEREVAMISEKNLNLNKNSSFRSIGEIGTMTPSINWKLFLGNVLPSGIRYTRSVFVRSLDYQRDLELILRSAKPVELQAYFIWMLIRQLSYPIPAQYIAPILRTPDDTQKRWKSCVQAVQSELSGIVGYFFVQKTFGYSSRSMAKSMVDSIRKAFRKSIEEAAWLDESTRIGAIKKLDKVVAIIGYDPKFHSSLSLQNQYSNYVVKENDYFGNRLRYKTWSSDDLFRKINSVVHREETVRAPLTTPFYNTLQNLAMFPASYLQPPLFHPDYPEYVNFGGMGAIIGHEYAHAFDNFGRQYDGEGYKVNWWSKTSRAAFDEKAQCFVDQFNHYTVKVLNNTDLHVNGTQTLKENLADDGGIRQAFRAWRTRDKSVKEQFRARRSRHNPGHCVRGHKSPLLPGLEEFTVEQLLFLSHAQHLCRKHDPVYLERAIKTDQHSPGEWRVNGVLRNSEEFAAAFSCKSDAPMNPIKKCRLW